MMSFLSSFILGSLEDNVGVFSTYWLLKNPSYTSYVGYPFGTIFDYSNTSEPLFLRAFFWLMLNFDSVVFYNFFILASLSLTGLVAYFFYKSFSHNKLLSLLSALLLVFSPYFYFQYRSHITLIQFWLVVVFVFLLFRAKTWINYLVLGFYLTFVALISNYFAYFCLLILGSYLLSKELVSRALGSRYWSIKVLGQHIFSVFVFSVTFIPFLISYFRSYYTDTSPAASTQNLINLGRSVEDFFIFTSRPWYYLLPSDINPFFGNITTSIISWMQNDWGYFLAQNYFRSEHSASYLGWISLSVAIFGLYCIIKKVRTKEVSQTETDLLVITGVIIILMLFTMPPYLTLAGFKIYMPSYLLFKAFPMFRVLTRLGVVILMFLLVLSSYGYKEIFERLCFRIGRIATVILISLLVLFSFAEFFVPIKITKVDKIPDVFAYIRDETPKDSLIAVYPHEKANIGQFWIKDYGRPFVNPFGIVNTRENFESEKFTEELNTCAGIKYAAEIGVDYIVVFSSDFIAGDNLTKVKDFPPTLAPAPIYKFLYVSYAGADEPSSLYKVTNAPVCD